MSYFFGWETQTKIALLLLNTIGQLHLVCFISNGSVGRPVDASQNFHGVAYFSKKNSNRRCLFLKQYNCTFSKLSDFPLVAIQI